LILCRFYRDLYPWEFLCEIVEGATGLKADQAMLQAISTNISNVVRRFNLREGLRREDDRLPGRLHKEALATGRHMDEADLEKMVGDYYRLRGWDEEGRPE
jgi:aldehyde:ferredoxin oxidoreductase